MRRTIVGLLVGSTALTAPAIAADLTLNSPVYDTTGQKYGSAALASGDGTAASTIPAGATSYTIETWLRMTLDQWNAGAAAQAAIVTPAGPALGYLSQYAWARCDNASASITNSTYLTDGKWHHLALTMTPTVCTLWVDGVRAGTSSTVTPAIDGTTILGNLIPGNSTYAFQGEIDDVGVWNYARYTAAFTPAQIAPATAGLASLYALDSSAADTASTAALLSMQTPASIASGSTATISGAFSGFVPSTWSYTYGGGAAQAFSPAVSNAGWSFVLPAQTAAGTLVVTVTDTLGATHSASASIAVGGIGHLYPLTWAGTPAYDTTGQKFGAAAAVGGYGSSAISGTFLNWTLSAWAKTQTVNGLAVVASTNSGAIYMAIDGNGNATATVAPGIYFQKPTQVRDGNWHQFELVCSGGLATFYVDGASQGTSPNCPTLTNPTVTLGALSSAGGYVMPGELDQAAFWGYSRHTAAFVPGSTALTGNEAGLVALWPLDSALADATAAGVTTLPGLTVATPANAVAGAAMPVSGSFNGAAPSGVSVAFDGGAYAAVTGFQTSGDRWSGTATMPAAGAHTMTAQRADSASTTATTPSFQTAAAVVVPVSDQRIAWSPYNWANGKTIAPGYLRFTTTSPTVSLTFDLSGNLGPLPQVWYRVDGGLWTRATLAATLQMTSTSFLTSTAATHYVEIVTAGSPLGVDRWGAQANAITLTGIVLAPGTDLSSKPAVYAKTVGVSADSIGEGIRVLGLASANDVDQNDYRATWAYALRDGLHAEVGCLCFGSSGLTATAPISNVPVAGTVLHNYWSGKARTFGDAADPIPDLWIVEHGTNDALTDAATYAPIYQAFLSDLVATFPATTKIVAMRPFGGFEWPAIQTAVQQLNSARVSLLDTTGMFNSAESADNEHPDAVANATALIPGIMPGLSSVLYPAGSARSFVFY